jgi:hypothetical protein
MNPGLGHTAGARARKTARAWSSAKPLAFMMAAMMTEGLREVPAQRENLEKLSMLANIILEVCDVKFSYEIVSLWWNQARQQ